jgi:hypothetical protein
MNEVFVDWLRAQSADVVEFARFAGQEWAV